MSTLLVWREKLQEIYAKYSTYILKALQLILGLVLFGLINANIGFMKMASSVFCTVGLAVICTFFPMIIMVTAAAALILVHFSDNVHFLFPVYTEESMACAYLSTGFRIKDTVSRSGSFRSYGHTCLDRSGMLRCDRLLYGGFCQGFCSGTQEYGCGCTF